MSNTSILDLRGIDLDVDPFLHSDDLSILSFSNDITGRESHGNEVGSPGVTPKPKNTLLEIEISQSVPVSDDESISEASLFSDISFRSMCDDVQQEVSQTACPPPSPSPLRSSPSSMEAIIVNLNRTMMRSARTRALINKTVIPNLRKSNNKLGPHKVQLSSAKHKYSKNKNGIATQSLVLGISKDNSICGFLRATKKW